jgi:hypothetical protein
MNYVIGKSKILFLLRNSYFVIGTTLFNDWRELALRAASEMPPAKLGEKNLKRALTHE